MTIAQEEIFGPVLSILPYETEEDAIRIANDSMYGLAGSVWTTNYDKAIEIASKIRTGTYAVNMYAFDPGELFGGYQEFRDRPGERARGHRRARRAQERAAAVRLHAEAIDMSLFRAFLTTCLIVVTVYTAITIAHHGADLLPVFFGDMVKLDWPGQFNLDFMTLLLLSGLWVAWRHQFSANGLALGVPRYSAECCSCRSTYWSTA